MARRYSEEFKQEAVRLYRSSGKGTRKIAEELGISHFALRQWVKLGELSPEAVSESEELKRLRQENRVLREEREILRKAAAFFAKESR